MINSAQLSWTKLENVFLFEVRDGDNIVQPTCWSKYNLYVKDRSVCVDILFRTIQGKYSQINKDGILCSDAFIASLTESEVQQLALPPVSHTRLKIIANGLISQQGFNLTYRLITPEGRPIMGAKISDVRLIRKGNSELLLDPLYSIIKKIDEFNKIKTPDRDERFVQWGEIQKLLPEGSVVDGQLQNITICRADKVTLDIREHGVFNPALVQLDNTKDFSLQGQADVEYVLPKIRQNAFENQFKNSQLVRSNYAVGNGTYVVVPKRVQDILSVIKKHQTKDTEERLAFISNPQKFINEALENSDNSDDIESIFIETPDFISQRIETIGVWSPKLCAYIAKRDGDWIPDDEERLFFPIDNLLVNFTIDEMKQLLNEVNIALDNEIRSISFNGQEIPVSLETKNLLIRMLKYVDSIKNSAPMDIPHDVIAPILKDNIEDVEFKLIKQSPRPNISRLPEMLLTKTLYEHQKFGVNWLAEHWESGSIGALLADDMGLGKTIQTLTFLASIKQIINEGSYPQKPFLIVAPSGLLKNWKDEANMHIEADGLGTIFEAYGTDIRRLKDLTVIERNTLISRSGWVLTTYETLRDKIKYFLSIDWGVIVFDEAQKIKNPVSRMTEMAKSLSADFTLMLTGTPVENELKDLWCIVDTAQPGLFGSLSHFHKEYVQVAENSPSEAGRLKALLVEKSNPPLMMRRLKADHLQGLPEKNIINVPIVMPEMQANEYENIVRDAQLTLGSAGSVLETIQKIRKASLIAEEFDGNGITDGVIKRSARLTALIDILDRVQVLGEKVIIFCDVIEVQEYLAGYLQNKYQLASRPFLINGSVNGDTRKEYVDKFQSSPEGEFNVMILSSKAGGVGLTITAANHVIHLTRWWNPAVEDQCTDRVFRIGQSKDVNVYLPMAIHPKYKKASFDHNLNNLLSKKRELSYHALMPATVTKNEIAGIIKHEVMN